MWVQRTRNKVFMKKPLSCCRREKTTFSSRPNSYLLSQIFRKIEDRKSKKIETSIISKKRGDRESFEKMKRDRERVCFPFFGWRKITCLQESSQLKFENFSKKIQKRKQRKIDYPLFQREKRVSIKKRRSVLADMGGFLTDMKLTFRYFLQLQQDHWLGYQTLTSLIFKGYISYRCSKY